MSPEKELVLLREAVRELAAQVERDHNSRGQELLYRLKLRGVDTGLPFSPRCEPCIWPSGSHL